MEEKNKFKPVKISFDIPPYLKSVPEISDVDLTATEQKLYLQLSLEFQIILNKASNFQIGAYEWNQILPDRLQSYGITQDTWERISNKGDNSEEIQEQLANLIERMDFIFGNTEEEEDNDILFKK